MSGGGVSSGVAAVVAAVAALDVDELTSAEDLTAVLEARSSLEAKALAAFGRHHAEGRCDVDGFRSPVGWLRAHVHLTDGDAKALAHRARTVQAWPTMQRLWVEGRLTGAQVATAVAMVPRAFRDLFAEHDAELSPVLVGCTLDETREALVDWVARAEALLSPDPAALVAPDEVAVAGFFRISRYGPDDQGAVAGDLDGDTTTIVEHALTVAERPDREGEDRLVSQRRAEALRRVCEFFLAHRGCDRGAGVGAGIVAVFDLPALYRAALRGLGVHDTDGLDRLVESHDVSLVEEGFLRDALAHSSGRGRTLEGLGLSPDAVTTLFGKGSTIERVLLADGRVLDHGRKVRLFKGPLRDLLLVRDRGCRFPTPTGERCDAPVGWVQGHHVTEWDHGGVTSETNGAGACASHHGVLHRDGWSFEVHADGSMTVTRPDGTTWTSPPPWAARPPTLPLHHPELDRLLRPRARPRPDADDAHATTGLEPARPAEPAGPDVHHQHEGDEGDGIDQTRPDVEGVRPGDAARTGRSRVAPQVEDEEARAGATVPEPRADVSQPTDPTEPMAAQACRGAALDVLERHRGAGRADLVARLPGGTTLAIDLAA